MMFTKTQFNIETATYEGDPEYTAPTISGYGTIVSVSVETANNKTEQTIVWIDDKMFKIETLKEVIEITEKHLKMLKNFE